MWQQAGGRQGWTWRTEVAGTMKATKTKFLLHAHLRAYHGNTLIAEREFASAIPRDHL